MGIIKKIMKKVEESIADLKDIKKIPFIIEPYNIHTDIWYGDWKSNIDLINKNYDGIEFDISKFSKKNSYVLYIERNDGSPYFIILLSNKNGILHESLHLSWYIAEICDIKLTWDNHETQAYLLQYLNDKIYSLVQNY
jgi:hypothetical protein